MNVVGQALALAAQGYPVFPVATAKRPTCPQGFKDASLDPREIRRLWRDHPAPLIGVPTGEPTGLFVLDIDSPRHPEAAEWFERCAPYLPETRQQTTRSGGTHLFFNHHPGLRNSAGRVARGVDTRATGGFIIVWTPAVWLTEPRPLADLPSWLIKAATTPLPPVVRQSDIPLSAKGALRKVEGIVGAVAAAQSGQRNALAFWGHAGSPNSSSSGFSLRRMRSRSASKPRRRPDSRPEKLNAQSPAHSEGSHDRKRSGRICEQCAGEKAKPR